MHEWLSNWTGGIVTNVPGKSIWHLLALHFPFWLSSLLSPPSSENTLFCGRWTENSMLLSPSEASILAGPTDLEGRLTVLLDILKNKARLGTGLQHDTWFPMDLCKGQIPLQTIVRGRLWCCLVGSNFEESDEARKACRSPCLNLKYKFKEKLKAKWETWVYIQMWVVTSLTGTENKRELTEEIWDQVVKTRAKPLFQHKPVALPLESNALWNCKHYYLIAFSLFCLGTIYMNEKQLQK